MKNIFLSELSQPVRDFLSEIERSKGVVIHDGEVRLIVSPIRCPVPTEEERARAWRDLERIQEQVGAGLRSLGVTEEEFDRAVQAEFNRNRVGSDSS